MLLIILWLFEDLLTVATGGTMQIPCLFILRIVFCLLLDTAENNEDDSLWAVWTAFAGGMLWDLRWIGIPGFFTLGYVLVVLLVIYIWGLIPPQGRSSGNWLLVFVLLEASQLIPPLLPFLVFSSSEGWKFFLRQQLYSLPVVLLTLYVYAKKVSE